MSARRGIRALAALVVLSATPGCDMVDEARDRFGTTDTLAVASGSGLTLGLQAPGTLAAGEEGVLRLAVENGTDTTVTGIRLELIVPGWAEPMPPRAGDREVTMAALEEGGTRFAYGMQETPIEPGETQHVEQRIRVPAEGTASESDSPWTRLVLGRLLDMDGEALAEVQGEISLDAAADAALGAAAGMGGGRDRIGPVRLGMTASALRQTVSSAEDTSWTQDGTSRSGAWVSLPEGGRVLAGLNGDSVVRLEVRDPAVRTREGLGIGSRLEALRSAYGAPCARTEDGALVVWFARAPGVSFALDTPDSDDSASLRANPDRIPASAQVERWWLRRGGEDCAG